VRRRVLGTLAVTGIVTACASIAGVGEILPLAPPGEPEAGAAVGDSAMAPDATGTVPVPTCTGRNCPCSATTPCASDLYKVCSPEGKCVQCTPETDSCQKGYYCLPSNECAFGCSKNERCADAFPDKPFCNVDRHDCVECLVKADCDLAESCSGGRCVAACLNEGGPCGLDNTGLCCGGYCIDPTNDPEHCGSCTKTCGAAEKCCNRSCVNTQTNKDNCGQCGAPCATTNASSTKCELGICKPTCNSGFDDCNASNDACETATTVDPAHCGSCSTVCAAAILNASTPSCADSKCTYLACNDGFRDGDGNRSNGCEQPCGDLGQVCCPACRNNMKCQADRCCKNVGQSCTGNADCCSGSCNPGQKTCKG
jgi:hypothetical protein